MPTILIRRISPYLGPDILLGVFSSPQEAEQQRSAYLTSRTQTPASDPWHQQPYKSDGLQASDLIVMDVKGSCVDAGALVFVVSGYSEGFGQIVRGFVSVHTDRAVAERQAGRLEEAESASFINFFLVQEAISGELLSDAPDAQPNLYG
jgi:hypothetical protein